MVRTSCSLLVAGKDTSFNVLVSRVGIKLDEGHLPLKFAVFPVSTKRNTVPRVTLTPHQVNIPPPLCNRKWQLDIEF